MYICVNMYMCVCVYIYIHIASGLVDGSRLEHGRSHLKSQLCTK